MTSKQKITEDNYSYSVLTFRDRQAGISVVFDPSMESYSYNVYCLEKKLLKELFTCEYQYLDEALQTLNDEFGSWDLSSFDKKGCGSCVAK